MFHFLFTCQDSFVGIYCRCARCASQYMPCLRVSSSLSLRVPARFRNFPFRLRVSSPRGFRLVPAPSPSRRSRSRVRAIVASLLFLLPLASLLFLPPLALCIAFQICARAIRVSFSVNLSNFFSASSRSVFPMSVFINLTEVHSANCHKLVYALLTHSALLHLFRRDSENRDNLGHYLNHYFLHFRCRIYFGKVLEAPEERFHLVKAVQKGLVACPNVLSCLGDKPLQCAHTRILMGVRTERRTPIPVKITCAGENICQMNMRTQISNEYKNILGQHLLQASQRMRRGRLRLDQAISTIDSGVDLAHVFAFEVWSGRQRECHRLRAGRRVDVLEDPLLSALYTCPRLC